MNPSQTRRPRLVLHVRRAGAALVIGLALVASAVAAAGCGSSPSATPASGATPTSIQVLATATRGDLTLSAMGQAKRTKAGSRPVAEATIDAQNASSVAAGQTARLFFCRGGSFPQPAPSGLPQPGQSGVPMPQGDAGGAPFSQDGQGGFPGGAGQRGGTAGAVTALATNADGAASVTISLAGLPSGAKIGSTGVASIAVKVLASNVIFVPTAAVKGSGTSVTVQVVANGTMEARTVTVGQQSGGMTEVVSGLNEGESVVYTRTFRGFPGGGRRGAPFPQGGQSGMPFPQQGEQSNGQSGGSY
jgi:hypothetical protein